MRTKAEFVDHWKQHLAGMALYGVVSELRDGPLVRASKVLDLPREVEGLLGRMYDWVGKANEPPRTNGHADGHAVLPLPQRKVTP